MPLPVYHLSAQRNREFYMKSIGQRRAEIADRRKKEADAAAKDETRNATTASSLANDIKQEFPRATVSLRGTHIELRVGRQTIGILVQGDDEYIVSVVGDGIAVSPQQGTREEMLDTIIAIFPGS